MYFIRAPRNITSNRPIETLEDLAGLTIRVPEAPANVRLFERLGAKVTTLPFSEVIPALQTGVIDAQENPLDLLVDFKVWEVQKYVAETEHQRQAIFFVVAERAYQQLSDDIKEIMYKAAKIAQQNEYERFKEQQKEWKSILEENGMIFTYPDQSKFCEAVRDAFDDFGEPLVSLIQMVRETD